MPDASYWSNRYRNHQTQWDIGFPSTPLKTYIDQLENKEVRILIPGCGNAYEAEYLHQRGFINVTIVDIAEEPLTAFKNRIPSFPEDHLVTADFFELDGKFDLILEQTFFCALNPKLRVAYVEKMNSLLSAKGKLVGVLFNIPLNSDKPPFGGHIGEYSPLFNRYLTVKVMEKCYNSIEPRRGNELFVIATKKQ